MITRGLRHGVPGAFLLVLAFLLLPANAPSDDTPTPPTSRLYLATGLGFADLGRRVGIAAPLGATLVLDRVRLIGSVGLLDLTFTEGTGRDPDFYRPVLGSTLCVDRQTGRAVPDYWCSGGTDVLRSASADLGYVLLDEVWIGDQPGKLFVGAGQRFRRPRTPYGIVGFYFDRRQRVAAGARLSVGHNYVSLGVVWGLEVRRLLR